MPIPVIHLITDLRTGGAQRALYQLLAHQSGERFTVPVVCCMYGGDSLVSEQIQALGIPVVDLEMKTRGNLRGTRLLYRLLRRHRPHILHCWMFHANLLGRLAGRVARVPHIITSRRNVEIGGPMRERLTRWTRVLDDHVIAVCEAAREAEIERTGAAPEKVTTVHNGVILEEFPVANSQAANALRDALSLPHDSCLIGTICRLHAQKGLEHLLIALARIVAQLPSVHLLIVGTGELRAVLEEQALSLGIVPHVHFLGEQRDVGPFLAGLDLFVLPSLWEGLPNVVLEAMAVALPVVATAVGGTAELVIPGETGHLVPPANPDALAQAMISLLRDPESAAAMGTHGRERVASHFTVERMVAQIEALYHSLLRC